MADQRALSRDLDVQDGRPHLGVGMEPQPQPWRPLQDIHLLQREVPAFRMVPIHRLNAHAQPLGGPYPERLAQREQRPAQPRLGADRGDLHPLPSEVELKFAVKLRMPMVVETDTKTSAHRRRQRHLI